MSEAYRYVFSENVLLEDVEASLVLALLPSRVSMGKPRCGWMPLTPWTVKAGRVLSMPVARWAKI